MAVTVGHRGDDSYIFFALSTDNYPTTIASGNNIPIGSTLYVTDLNEKLRWTGNFWYNEIKEVEEPPVVVDQNFQLYQDQLTLLNAILAQLKIMSAQMGASFAVDPVEGTEVFDYDMMR